LKGRVIRVFTETEKTSGNRVTSNREGSIAETIRLSGWLSRIFIAPMAVAALGLTLGLGSPSEAGSVLSLPLPEDIPVYTDDSQYNRYMTLEIKMPENFKDPQPLKKKEPKVKNFDYFDFNPQKRLEDDPEIHRALKSLIKKGLAKSDLNTSGVRDLYRRGRLNSRLTVGALVRLILGNFLKLEDEDILRKTQLDRENLEDILFLAGKFKHELFLFNNLDTDAVKARVEEVRKLLKFNQGVVRVIKVENDMKGGTILHFVVRENQFQENRE
jgi:hypothetical protein